jgi:hypothetical protein
LASTLTARRRAAAVVDSETLGHDDQKRPDIDRRELDAKELAYDCGLLKRVGDRGEVGLRGDDRNLDPVPASEHHRHPRLQRARRVRARRRHRQENVLCDQDLARRVAVRTGRPGQG